MAVTSIAQLKAWFKRGAYPTAEQFAAVFDSFFHREEKIPLNTVDGLADRINDKYDRASGEALANQHARLATDFAAHESANDSEFVNVWENLDTLSEGLETETARATDAEAALGERITDVQVSLVEVREVAEGASRGLSFATKQQLDGWLAGTYARPDGLTVADLRTGDNLYIEEADVPDYWWNGAEIVELDTQKVDMTGFYNKEQADLRFVQATALDAEAERAAAAEAALEENTLYRLGEWDSASVPYRRNALVKSGGYMFRALRETSIPPVGLLTSEGQYLTSEGYLYAGPPEQFLNADDWEIFAVTTRVADQRTLFIPIDESDAVQTDGSYKVGNHLQLLCAQQVVLLPQDAVYNGLSVIICNPDTSTVTLVLTEDGSDMGGLDNPHSGTTVQNGIKEFLAVQMGEAVKWIVRN